MKSFLKLIAGLAFVAFATAGVADASTKKKVPTAVQIHVDISSQSM